MDLISFALTSLENLKEYLQIQDQPVTKDNLLKRLINGATMAMEGHCKKGLKARSFTEIKYLDTSSYNLFLTHYPINSVTSISNKGVDLTASELAECENRGTYLKMDQKRSGKVVAVYNGGYSDTYDLEQACLMLVRYWYKMDIADFSTVFAENGSILKPLEIPPSIKKLLTPYVRKMV